MSRILIVGGACQGKREYTARAYGLKPVDFGPGGRGIDRLHELVRERMQAGGLADLPGEIEERGDWVVLCDEIGGGVVPLDHFEREWREAVGRLCCELAKRADIVERVICGLPLRLKGERDAG